MRFVFFGRPNILQLANRGAFSPFKMAFIVNFSSTSVSSLPVQRSKFKRTNIRGPFARLVQVCRPNIEDPIELEGAGESDADSYEAVFCILTFITALDPSLFYIANP